MGDLFLFFLHYIRTGKPPTRGEVRAWGSFVMEGVKEISP